MAALQAGIYIPHICWHPDLPPVEAQKPAGVIYRGTVPFENKQPELAYEGCQLCVVEVEGREGLHQACNIPVEEGMVVRSSTPEALEFRRDKLALILAKHPHACLTCAQREGCARFPCSMNIPENERCCSLFGNCELQRISEYVGIKPETPRFIFEDLAQIKDEPLFERDYNLCIGCTRCIRGCRELRGIEAIDFVFNKDSRVTVGSVGPNPSESACRFCTTCVAVCPTGALMDKGKFDEVPCQAACPAGIDVAQYVYLVGEGKPAEATAIIREKVPFPKVLGYICPHPCEQACRRTDLNGPIAIRALKRFAAENDDHRWKGRLTPVTATGKKVAIVGSGPAGLTAAYYLARKGHQVTVFEALPVAGGMMRAGIPDYRLPVEVLEEEIKEIEDLGIKIATNSPVESLDELFEQGYSAVFTGVGAHRGTSMGIEGETTPGIVDGVDFLREVNLGKEVKIGDKVLVVGGGNVAIDASRTALRLGAKEVTIIYRRTRAEMPASEEEIEEALEEGIKITYLANPTRVTSANGKLKLEAIRMQLGKPDASGRPRPEPVEGSEFSEEYDLMIKAIGQESIVPDKYGLETARGGRIKVNAETLATSRQGVFAGGDVVSGPATVIEAIAGGRKAASAIDKYLGGDGNIEEELSPERESPACMGREVGFSDKSRVKRNLLGVQERISSFDAVEFSLSQEEAAEEGRRCLRCDSRFNIAASIWPPRQKLWTEFTPENISQAPETEGVYQLLDEQEQVIYIKGAMNLRRELGEQITLKENARYFVCVEEPMYTKKESELLQQYITAHGEMPEGNRELDDLF